MASRRPREWRFDASACAFIRDGSTVRVLALFPEAAARIDGARQQVEGLYRGLSELTQHATSQAAKNVVQAFHEPTNPTEVTRLARTVLVYFDKASDTPSDHVAACTRVFHDGEHVVVAPVSVQLDLIDDTRRQVLHAIVEATEELAVEMVREATRLFPDQPTMISRDLHGVCDLLSQLYADKGYSVSLMDRVIMTASLKTLNSADTLSETNHIDGVEIRALDLVRDNVRAVFDLVNMAFGSGLSFAAWICHYAQQPRFAPEMSFVAWLDERPIAVSLLELLVDGEGGGDDEVGKALTTSSSGSSMGADTASLIFPPDYNARQVQIRAQAKTAYVCGVATLPGFRGKHLAQTLLRRNFQAASRSGIKSIVLGTDRYNRAAVRAYSHAGMVETAVKTGLATGRIIQVEPRVLV